MSDKRRLDYFGLWLLGVTALVLPLQPSVLGISFLQWMTGWEEVMKLILLALAWHGFIVVHPKLRLDTSIVLVCLWLMGLLLGHTLLLSAYSPTFLLWQWIFFLLMVPALTVAMRHYGWRAFVIALLVGALQAQWAVIQFAWQRDLGMYLLGESYLRADVPGVAKFLLMDHKIVRAYGPYSHPNSLGALMLIMLLLETAWLKIASHGVRVIESSGWRSFMITLSGFILLALLLSFSRTGWLALGLLVLVYFWRHILSSGIWIPSVSRRWLLGAVVVLVLFFPLIFFRVTDSESVAFSERLLGVSRALDIIATRPLQGVGIGAYPQALQEWLSSSSVVFNSWEVTYVHMVPLLAAAELGVLGVLFIGIGLSWLLCTRDRILLLVPLLPFFLLDHFLYTYPVMWFWLVLLFVLGGLS